MKRLWDVLSVREKKARVRAIHAKIANTRMNALHQFSSELVKRSGAIFVGNVSSEANSQDQEGEIHLGWSMFKTMLEYKCSHAGIVFGEVNESYTTQTCSCCGEIPLSSPKGRAGLGIRCWTCSECGAVHDRDVNAAKNIARRGLASLAEGALQ